MPRKPTNAELNERFPVLDAVLSSRACSVTSVIRGTAKTICECCEAGDNRDQALSALDTAYLHATCALADQRKEDP